MKVRKNGRMKKKKKKKKEIKIIYRQPVSRA